MKKNFFSKLFRISLVLSIALVCIYLFLNSAFFNLDKITFTGLSNLTVDEMEDISKITLGTNIFKINSELYAKDFTLHPKVKKVAIIKHIPREIEVSITERVTWAIMPYEDKFLFIDDEGFCIDQTFKLQQLDYPIVTIDEMPDHVYPGRLVRAQGIDSVKQVWDELSTEVRKNISDLHYSSQKEELIIYTTRGTEVRFGNMERIKEKATFLIQLITIEDDLQNEGHEVLQYFDLRFKGQPIIKMGE